MRPIENKFWIAYVEQFGKHWWRYTVKRPESYYDDPKNGIPFSRDSFTGYAFTYKRAKKKARRLLSAKILSENVRHPEKIYVRLSDY